MLVLHICSFSGSLRLMFAPPSEHPWNWRRGLSSLGHPGLEHITIATGNVTMTVVTTFWSRRKHPNIQHPGRKKKKQDWHEAGSGHPIPKTTTPLFFCPASQDSSARLCQLLEHAALENSRVLTPKRLSVFKQLDAPCQTKHQIKWIERNDGAWRC